jgi:hypothetical protein
MLDARIVAFPAELQAIMPASRARVFAAHIGSSLLAMEVVVVAPEDLAHAPFRVAAGMRRR